MRGRRSGAGSLDDHHVRTAVEVDGRAGVVLELTQHDGAADREQQRIVEGTCTGAAPAPRIPAFLTAYNAKYTWEYTVDEYGPPIVVAPTAILAWRSGGWAGRDGFQQTAKWITEPARDAAPPAP